MSSIWSHAWSEFHAAGWADENCDISDEMQKALCHNVLELLTVFSNQGHSGTTAPYVLNLFTKLAKYEPLVPLTGEDWEWTEVSEGMYQNKRCSHVFKDVKRFGGQAYDIQAIVFYDRVVREDGSTYKSHFTNGDSHQPITFPYTPVTVYKERPHE